MLEREQIKCFILQLEGLEKNTLSAKLAEGGSNKDQKVRTEIKEIETRKNKKKNQQN